MRLNELTVGRSAKVAGIFCAKKAADRLMRTGLTVGVTVTLVRRAPLGDPIELKVRGCYLALRNSAAEKIEVEEIGAEKKADKKTVEG